MRVEPACRSMPRCELVSCARKAMLPSFMFGAKRTLNGPMPPGIGLGVVASTNDVIVQVLKVVSESSNLTFDGIA